MINAFMTYYLSGQGEASADALCRKGDVESTGPTLRTGRVRSAFISIRWALKREDDLPRFVHSEGDTFTQFHAAELTA
jgi:hypothetical protein